MKENPLIKRYIDLLKEHNGHTNVYSKNAYDKLPFHIQDSINLSEYIKPGQNVIDMGSGSGLPSIILAILCPKNKIYAVESRGRKAAFLNIVQSELALDNLTVVNLNINEYFRQDIRCDVFTAKAFAPYDKVIKIASRIANPGNKLYIPISKVQHDMIKQLNIKNVEMIQKGEEYFYLNYNF